MQAERSTHPDADALRAYGLGNLGGAAEEWIAGHIEACPACRELVANMPPDRFVRGLMAALAPPPQDADAGGF